MKKPVSAPASETAAGSFDFYLNPTAGKTKTRNHDVIPGFWHAVRDSNP